MQKGFKKTTKQNTVSTCHENKDLISYAKKEHSLIFKLLTDPGVIITQHLNKGQ